MTSRFTEELNIFSLDLGFTLCDVVRKFTIILVLVAFAGENSQTDGRCEPSGGQTSCLVQREETAAGARTAGADSQGQFHSAEETPRDHAPETTGRGGYSTGPMAGI